VVESYVIAKLSSGTSFPVLHNRGSVHNLPSPTEHPSMSGTLLLGSLLSANKNTWVQQPIIMVRFPADTRDFSLFEFAHNGSTAHPAYSMESGGFFPGLKCSGSERDHPPPTSANVSNEQNYTSTSAIFMASQELHICSIYNVQ